MVSTRVYSHHVQKTTFIVLVSTFLDNYMTLCVVTRSLFLCAIHDDQSIYVVAMQSIIFSHTLLFLASILWLRFSLIVCLNLNAVLRTSENRTIRRHEVTVLNEQLIILC